MKTRDFIHKTKTKIMKTGGTLNFLKRTGAILMLLAIFVTSCNKYDDDFQSLKDAIAALDVKVNGVAQLQADLTALKTQVSSVQTALGSLATSSSVTTLATNLAALATKVDGLTTTLGAVASAGTATKAVVDGLKTDLAAVKADIAGVKTDLAAAKTALAAAIDAGNTATQGKIAALQTEVVNQILASAVITDAKVASEIAAAKTALEAAIAANDATVAEKLTALETLVNNGNAATLAQIDTVLSALDAGNATTDAAIAALKIDLAAAQNDIAQILANTAIYNGSVTLVSDADVDFFMTKLAQLPVVNGSLTVNTAAITKMTELNTILTTINIVAGANAVSITASSTKALDLSNLATVNGNISIIGAKNILQSAVDLSKLTSVGGDFVISLDGPLSYPALTSVGGKLNITPYTTSSSNGIIGTTSVDFPALVLSATTPEITTTAANTILFASATSVTMPANNVTAVSGDKVASLKLTNSTLAAGVTINAKTGATIDLSSVTTTAGALTIGNVKVPTTVNLSNFATAGAGGTIITVGSTGSVNLDKFNSKKAITIIGAKEVSFPAWSGDSSTSAGSALTANEATVVSLPKYSWRGTAPALGSVEDLTVGAVDAAMDLTGYTTLVNVDITGKTVTTWATLLATVTTSALNVDLETVKLSGMLKSASITDNATGTIASVTSSGVINSFTLSDADQLTELTLGHTGFTGTLNGTPGAILNVNNCDAIETLTATNLDKVVGLSIQTNGSLVTMSFPALANLANVGAGTSASFAINGNKLRGKFTAAVTGPPFAEAVIQCAQLLNLAPYMILASPTATSGYASATYSLSYDKDLDGNALAETLATSMTNNLGVSAVITGANAISSVDEVGLIQ